MAVNKKQTRQKSILDELSIQPSLRISDLADTFNVSAETVRRDLDQLTQQGLIDRTYGGGIVRKSMQEPVLNERHNMLIEERQQIAKSAVKAMAGSKHFMIGSGATTVHVAKRMAFEMNNITVITHSFGVATVLSLNPTIKVFITPGRYSPVEGCMNGGQTIRYLQNYQADWVILGASGLDKEGATNAVIEDGEVFTTMIQQSSRSMIVADHTKYNEVFAAQYAKWAAIDMLVSDKEPPSTIDKSLKQAGTVLL